MSQTPAQELRAAAEKIRRAPETPLPPRAVKALADLLSNGVRFADFLTQHGDAVGVEGRLDVALARAILDEPGPAVTEPETNARVFAALHQSAEQDVSRVIDLYERWVKAGPPPLGASMARWWDARLVELNAALAEPKEG